MEMSKRIWGGHDYMPLVWDRWLKDKSGVLLTATADGVPVGTAKISVLSPGEVWLEGLRLHPDYQGRGLSKRIHQATFRAAVALNPRSVRYSTWIGNEASRRIAEKNGFWQIARAGWMWGKSRGDWRPRSRRATARDVAAVISFIEGSGCYADANGVAGVGWTFPQLNRRRIRRLVDLGQVLVLPRKGKIRAVAAWDIGKVDDDVCLGFVDGPDEDVTRLARDVLRVAADTGRSEASAMVPIGRLTDLVNAAGYDEWQPVRAVVYERGARGLRRGGESLEGMLQRTLRANESEVLDTVAQLLADRAPAPLVRENVRDYISRHLIPDTDRILIAATQRFFEALSSDTLRTVLRGVIEHMHYEHGFAAEAISASLRVIRVAHMGKVLATIRAHRDSITMTLGPGFGHCFPARMRFGVEEAEFPRGSRDRSGRHDSVILTLTGKQHVPGACRAIDVIMRSAARNP
jgi:GNAT superfamily N-acetyltransferase